MKGTILEKIVEAKRVRVDAAKQNCDLEALIEQAQKTRTGRTSGRFKDALSDRSRTNIIAEFKRASPSKGVINYGREPADAAITYRDGGAAAISVLTEEDFFKGSLDDLRVVRSAVDLPILRKDFVVDEFQIVESAIAGADAILLIVAVLCRDDLKRLQSSAHSLGMDAIVEAHDLDELKTAEAIGARIIGVNNRNLKTFDVSLNVSRELIKSKPAGTVMIAESGISTREEILELRDLGYDGFLIGETLMRSGDTAHTLRELAARDRV